MLCYILALALTNLSDQGDFMKNDILKALALRAKNRLIQKGNPESEKTRDYRIKIIKSGDEVFYDKVKALLERDEDVLNPIKELMDEKIYSSMTLMQKERYLLQTVEKYQKFKTLIEDEKALKVVY